MKRHDLLACMACLGSILLSGCATNTGALRASAPATPGVPAAAAAARFSGPLESILMGTWEGSLVMRPPLSATAKNAPPDPSDLRIRLVIHDEAAQIYLEESGDWFEAMPGKFVLTRVVTSASIVGVNSKDPAAGGWIENWALLVTAIDDNSLQAEWTRVVNNIDPPSEGLPTFSMAATGVLRRVSP